MICASEQAAIVDTEHYKEFIELMKTPCILGVNKEEKAT